MLKVVDNEFNGGPEPVEPLVQKLEAYLDMAKSGRLRGCVFLMTFADSSASFSSCGAISPSNVLLAFEGWRFTMLPGCFDIARGE